MFCYGSLPPSVRSSVHEINFDDRQPIGQGARHIVEPPAVSREPQLADSLLHMKTLVQALHDKLEAKGTTDDLNCSTLTSEIILCAEALRCFDERPSVDHENSLRRVIEQLEYIGTKILSGQENIKLARNVITEISSSLKPAEKAALPQRQVATPFALVHPANGIDGSPSRLKEPDQRSAGLHGAIGSSLSSTAVPPDALQRPGSLTPKEIPHRTIAVQTAPAPIATRIGGSPSGPNGPGQSSAGTRPNETQPPGRLKHNEGPTTLSQNYSNHSIEQKIQLLNSYRHSTQRSTDVRDILLSQDADGVSILGHALKNADMSCIQLIGGILKEKRLDKSEVTKLLMAKDNAGVPGLYWALAAGRDKAVSAFGDLVKSTTLSYDVTKQLLSPKNAEGFPGALASLENGHLSAFREYVKLISDESLITFNGRKELVLGKDFDGASGLCYALRNGHEDAVSAFGEMATYNGTEVQVKTWGRESAYAEARSSKYYREVPDRNGGRYQVEPYHMTDTERFELLEAKDRSGVPGLHHALANGHLRAIGAFSELLRNSGLSDSKKRDLVLASLNAAYPAFERGHLNAIHLVKKMVGGIGDKERALAMKLLKPDAQGKRPLSEVIQSRNWAGFANYLSQLKGGIVYFSREELRSALDSLRGAQKDGAIFGNSSAYNHMKNEQPDLYRQFKALKDILKLY